LLETSQGHDAHDRHLDLGSERRVDAENDGDYCYDGREKKMKEDEGGNCSLRDDAGHPPLSEDLEGGIHSACVVSALFDVDDGFEIAYGHSDPVHLVPGVTGSELVAIQSLGLHVPKSHLQDHGLED